MQQELDVFNSNFKLSSHEEKEIIQNVKSVNLCLSDSQGKLDRIREALMAAQDDYEKFATDCDERIIFSRASEAQDISSAEETIQELEVQLRRLKTEGRHLKEQWTLGEAQLKSQQELELETANSSTKKIFCHKDEQIQMAELMLHEKKAESAVLEKQLEGVRQKRILTDLPGTGNNK